MQNKSQNHKHMNRRGPLPLMLHLGLMAQNPNQMDKVLRGLHKYHHHPYSRKCDLPDREVIWENGSIKLYKIKAKNPSNKPPLLLIPSFINGSEILDLTPNRSLAAWLAKQAHDTYIIDWGELQKDKYGHALASIVENRLIPAFQFIEETYKKPPVICGYCLGGNIAFALANMVQQYSALILLATPWNFHHKDNKLRTFIDEEYFTIKDKAQKQETISPDFLQSLFIKTDLEQTARKYQNFLKLDDNSEEEKHFVAVEDWVNGGKEIPAALILECVNLFYKENAAYNGNWTLNSESIVPSNVKKPTLIFTPKSDAIVPHGCSKALARAMPKAHHIDTDTGHIGLIVGQKAKDQCWKQISRFLDEV